MPGRHQEPKTGHDAASAARPRRKVRCLGPRTKEHYFASAHPGERICEACRSVQRHLSSRAQTAPVYCADE